MAKISGNIDSQSATEIIELLDMLTKKAPTPEIAFLAAVIKRFVTIA